MHKCRAQAMTAEEKSGRLLAVSNITLPTFFPRTEVPRQWAGAHPAPTQHLQTHTWSLCSPPSSPCSSSSGPRAVGILLAPLSCTATSLQHTHYQALCSASCYSPFGKHLKFLSFGKKSKIIIIKKSMSLSWSQTAFLGM